MIQEYYCESGNAIFARGTGSLGTFEFPNRVNLSGPSLYCVARTLGEWKADTQ